MRRQPRRALRAAIACDALCLLLSSACAAPAPAPIRGIGKGHAADAGAGAQPRGYAVVSSDYSVTSIGLLRPDGSLERAEFVDSGSASAGLVTALSGDVVLPTASGERGVLTLLDRLRTDVITRIDLASGRVLGQLKAETPNAEAAGEPYSSNPQDYAYVDAGSAWISRYEPKLGAQPDDPDFGQDLLRIDPTHFTRTDARIDFSPWNSTAERANPDTGARESVTVYARPSGIVRYGTHAAVGIDSLSAGFDAAGDGMLAWVDLEQKSARVVTLPGLKNCGQVAAVPRDETHVVVACVGFFRGVPRDGAGIALVKLDATPAPAIEQVWRANRDAETALSVYAVVALGATEVLAVAPGQTAASTGGVETHDKLFRVDLVSGEQQEVFEAEGAYVLGEGSFEPETALVLVPDASADADGRPSAGVQRWKRLADGDLMRLGVTAVDPLLPPRQVRPFD